MEDAIARYRSASEANDIETMVGTLAADAELVSPVSGHMVFRGQADLRVLFSAVYGSLTGLRWTEEMGNGTARTIIGSAHVGPLRVTDAMVIDLDPDGAIRRIRPHLRPWLALTWFALTLAPKVGRHPGVVWRALRAR